MGGVVSVLMAIIGSVVIPNVKAKQLCENVCVPLPTDAEWMQNAWITNTNTSRNPTELLQFSVYNITNPNEVLNGSTPVITEFGPFVYQMYRKKYNIKYSANNEQVSFEELNQYHFRADLSGNVTEDDVFTTVTLPAVGSLQLAYSMDPVNFWPVSYNQIASTWCGQDPAPNPDPCLFTQMTAKQLIWGYDSYDLYAGNNLFFGSGSTFFDSYFSLWFNNTNETQKFEVDNNGHNYGLGGKCVLTDASFGGLYALPLCEDPASTNQTLTTTIMTGHNDDAAKGLSEINMYVKWRGNTTLDTWADKVSVSANDQYQFKTDLATTDKLSVLDPKLMRTVDLEYSKTGTGR